MVNTPILEDDQDNGHNLPNDVPVIIINDTSSGSGGDHLVEIEETTEITPVKTSSKSGIGWSLETVTIENESAEPKSELEVASCLVSTSPNKDVATSSKDIAPIDNEEDFTEGLGHLFSKQEEVLVIKKRKAIGEGTGSCRTYKVNYDKPSASTPSPSPSSSSTYVISTGQNVNPDDVNSVNANESERPLEPFKYDLVDHIKHIPARLHVLGLL